MKKAIVLEPADIKQIIADKFNVAEENVIKSQYTYTVIVEGDEKHEIPEHIHK